MHSGLSWCIRILPFLEEGQPLKEPMFVLGSEQYERTFFAGFPPSLSTRVMLLLVELLK